METVDVFDFEETFDGLLVGRGRHVDESDATILCRTTPFLILSNICCSMSLSLSLCKTGSAFMVQCDTTQHSTAQHSAGTKGGYDMAVLVEFGVCFCFWVMFWQQIHESGKLQP